jgi:hypothetical protein
LLAQPGACPPPISPQMVQAGATPGIDASCCSIRASRWAISSLIVSISRRCVAISKACPSPAGGRALLACPTGDLTALRVVPN